MNLHPAFRLVEGDKAWTAAVLDNLAAPWAAALEPSGVERGEPIALWSPNDVRLVLAILAARRLGLNVMLLHPRWTPSEARRALERVRPRILWCAPELRAHATAPEDCVVATLPEPEDQFGLPRLRGPVIHREDGYILYTSGSEGEPHAVQLAEERLLHHGRLARARLGSHADDRWLASLSFAHVGGLAMLLRCLDQGMTLVLPPPASYEIGRVVADRHITHASIVPTQLRRWLDTLQENPVPSHLRLVLVGGAALAPDLARRARDRGLPIRVTYGLTEAGSQVATAAADTPEGSPGRPFPDVQVEVRDPATGQRVLPPREGEIWIRGPTLFLGYVGEDELTQERLIDGWFATRDLGRIDANGDLWITGRASRRIITGGENVDPLEVERVIESHPDVLEACVVGLPDDEWGERVAAAVVLRPGVKGVPRDLSRQLERTLAPFKRPKQVEALGYLPRTATGKVRALDVRQMILDRLRR